MPSPEAATLVATILGGNAPGSAGSAVAASWAVVDTIRIVPGAGSSRSTSVVVINRAMPSAPNATPRGVLLIE